jgi:hypothetical protein
MVPGLGRGNVAYLNTTFMDTGSLFARFIFHSFKIWGGRYLFALSKIDNNLMKYAYSRIWLNLVDRKYLFANLSNSNS